MKITRVCIEADTGKDWHVEYMMVAPNGEAELLPERHVHATKAGCELASKAGISVLDEVNAKYKARQERG